MYLPINEWPVNQDTGRGTVPDEFIRKGKVSASVIISPTQEFSYERFRGRSFYFARNVTAWLLCIFRARSMKDLKLTVEDLEDAEVFMLKVSMRATKVMLDKGQLRSLRAQVTETGLIVLGGRAMEGLRTYYEQDEYPILTHKDPIAYLWIKKVHEEEHSGITKTVAKSRRRFWIVRARSVASKVRRSCYQCRVLDKELAQQKMAPLPTSRQTMSPTFHKVSLDLFGPLEIKDTVKKRTKRKVWGVVINCLSTRALYIDCTEDYGTDTVLQVLRRFMALRGSPSSIYSDKGSQLGAAADVLKAWALARKIEWDTAPAEGQHQNGASEALIKSVKRSLIHTIGQSVLTFAELQTVFFEVADVINSRPIGIVIGSDPMQPAPITPNHLILGRATSEAVQGSLHNTKDVNKRFQFLQSLVDDWWKRWYESVLPSLVPSYKWYQRHRNVKVGDVCLIQYKSAVKATYKLGRAIRVKKGVDGLVRTVTLAYRNANENVNREVDRPIHGIAVIVPIEEQASIELDPKAEEFIPTT